ncbi:MAG: hypothetical protein KC800_06235 [Candidatus Eremiobacteraeota bacterium]|nr:hypothetical protein [Candidatus Eremiobacteraeota bacterium]
MISKLPPKMQNSTRHFMETGEFRGPKTKLDSETSDRVLLSYDQNVINGCRQDNTEVDRNPAKGVVETESSRLEFKNTDAGLEFFTESLGEAPFKLVSYGVSALKGMDFVVGMTDQSGNVLSEGAVHLNRLYGDESFFAGDLKGLPT